MAPGDIGYVMGRVHTAGMIASPGLASILEWTVDPEKQREGRHCSRRTSWRSGTSAQDRFNVSASAPDSNKWIGPSEHGVYPEQAAGRRDIRQYLQRDLPPGERVQPNRHLSFARSHSGRCCRHRFRSGQCVWKATRFTRDGRFHTAGSNATTRRPSASLGRRKHGGFLFFTERTNVPVSQISSLACSPRIVSRRQLRGRQGPDPSHQQPRTDPRRPPTSLTSPRRAPTSSRQGASGNGAAGGSR